MDQLKPSGIPGTCRCGCGGATAANRNWIRGHASRGEGGFTASQAPLRTLPGPDEIDFDAGTIDLDGLAPSGPGGANEAGPGSPPAAPGQAPAGGLPPRPADEPPGHARREWRRGKQAARPPRPGRITAAIRSDIDAKLSLMLEVPGRLWQARDPVCGGVFVAQRPQIAGSLAEIVCRSPQLVEWFTGTGGGFLLYLDALAALWPVATVIMAHHVYHSIGGDQPEADPLEPDYSRYAA